MTEQPITWTNLRPTSALAAVAGLMRLARLSNSVPAAVLVLLGARLAGGWPLPFAAWQAAMAMWCVTAFGYVSNDCVDVAEDRVNKPDRPLPSGAVSPAMARSLALALAVGAVGISAAIGPVALLAAVAVLGLLLLYSLCLKGTPGGGNLLIAALAGCTLVVGSVTVHDSTRLALAPIWMPASLLMTFVAAREMVKALEDLPGDRAAGKRTLAVVCGPRTVVWIVAGLTVAASALGVLSSRQLGYGWPFLTVVMAGVVAPMLYTVVRLWRDAAPSRVSRCLALLKGSYFAGMAALLLA